MNNNRNKRRVVITGIGVISSIGIGKDNFWQAVLRGDSGIKEVSGFDTSDFKYRMGGEVPEFDPADFIPKRRIPFLGRTSQRLRSLTSCTSQMAGKHSYHCTGFWR